MGALASVTVQAGHAGWRSRSGYVYPAYGGAPGEAEWTRKLAGLIAERLERRGVGVTVIGQWLDPATNGTTELPAPPEAADPAALLVALHYDGAVYGAGNNTGCFADRWEFEAAETAPLCDAFVDAWQTSYARATGIPVRAERRNVNTRRYYVFKSVAVAPAVILEHGCGSPVPSQGFPPGQDAAFLHDHIERVADADTAAILAHLMERGFLPADGEDMAKVAELEAKVAELVSTNSALSDQVGALRAEVDGLNGQNRTRQEQIDALREEVAARNADVTRLSEALAAAPTAQRSLRRATFEFTDGSTQVAEVKAA